ncbi:MAG: hypothetical protein WBC39_06090 [Phycisphaerae bacterium]
MMPLAAAGLLVCVVVCNPRPARGGLGDLVDTVRDRLDSMLLPSDLIVTPGKEVQLKASLRTGLRLEGIPGRRIQFFRDDKLVGESRTDDDGNATATWQVPPAPGDYLFAVRVHPDDQPKRPAPDAELLVAARPTDAKIAVTDLDKTVVASGFLRVLAGGAKPMPGAAVVLERLAKDHTIVYLTHRPDVFGPSSRKWLAENRFPRGPVLTSTVSGFLAGSGRYKTDRLDDLKRTFKNLAVGIGDKLSDAQAYVENNVKSILILDVDWSEDDWKDYQKLADQLAQLPDTIHVVTNWSQISEILFQNAQYPKEEMEKRLREVADKLRRDGED